MDIRCQIDVRFVVSGAQLVQDKSWPIFVKASENPVCALHSLKRFGRNEPLLDRFGFHVRIDFPNKPSCELYLGTAGYGIIVSGTDESVAIGLVQFFVVHQRYAPDAQKREMLRNWATEATDSDQSDPCLLQFALTVFPKKPNVAVIALG